MRNHEPCAKALGNYRTSYMYLFVTLCHHIIELNLESIRSRSTRARILLLDLGARAQRGILFTTQKYNNYNYRSNNTLQILKN